MGLVGEQSDGPTQFQQCPLEVGHPIDSRCGPKSGGGFCNAMGQTCPEMINIDKWYPTCLKPLKGFLKILLNVHTLMWKMQLFEDLYLLKRMAQVLDNLDR